MARGTRVLVIEAAQGQENSLAAGLRSQGIETVGAKPSTASRLIGLKDGRPDYAIVSVDAVQDHFGAIDLVVADLVAAQIPSMLVGTSVDELGHRSNMTWHDIIPGQPSALFLANRIHAALRLNTMQCELDRRIATCARYGLEAPLTVRRAAELDEANILVLGPGAEFGAIDDALSASASIVGAFSPAMVIDYLAARPFDLVIADMGAGFETICDLAGDLRRDPRFHAMPLLLVGSPAESGWFEAALNAGITEVLPAPVAARALRSRALSLAREQRFAMSLKHVYEDARHLVSGDALTGLYTRGFLMAHLSSLLAEEDPVAFTLAAFEISNIADINARHGYAAGDRIIRQIGMMLGNLLRGEDLPARLGGARFAAILIGANSEAAEKTARRIVGFVNATQFGVPGEAETMSVRLRTGLADPAGITSPDEIIAAGLSRLA